MGSQTPQQRKSLHKFCGDVADVLNSHGITMQAFTENIEVAHSKDSVKSIAKAMAKVKFGTDKTSELTKEQYQDLINSLVDYVVLFVPDVSYPSKDVMYYEQINAEKTSHVSSNRTEEAEPGLYTNF